MKKRYKKKRRYTNMIPFIICILVLGLSVGFSAFNEEMLITDMVADIRLRKDIRVTNATVDNVSLNTVSQSLDYNKSNISDTVTLPNIDSTITYEVEITNIETQEMGIYDLTLSNSNLDYTIDNYTKKDKLCDDNNNLKCNLGSKSTIEITIFYKENMYDPNNLDQTFILDFDFRGFYTITYTDIPGNYQSTIMGGETLIVDFGENAPDKLLVYMNDIKLTDQDYTYENNVLTLTNVDGNIRISSYLPSEYQEVAYIESTGTQWIDTGVFPTYNTKLEIELMETKKIGFDIPFGASDTGGRSGNFEMYFNYGSKSNFTFSDNITANSIDNLSLNQKYKIVKDSKYNYVNDVLQSTNNTSTIFVGKSPIALFARHRNYETESVIEGYFIGKIYYVKIWNNGIPERELIPCYRISDNKPGMYDVVGRQFYINSGSSDDFKLPNEKYNIPDIYRQVDYIESTGVQYIDTQVPAGINIGIEADYAPNSRGTIFGAITSTGVGYFGVNMTGKFELYWERSVGSYNTWNSDQRYKISLNYLNNKSFYIDNSFIRSVNENGIITTSTIHLFKLNDPTHTFTQFINAKLYYVEITEADELIKQLIPCYRISDNKPGLYDLVNDEFLVNSGTGADFTIGPEVE